MNIDGLLLCSKCENQLRVRPYSGNHGFFVVDSCTHCVKVTMSKISNDDLSYLIVRSLTEGEIIKTIDEVDRDIIDDMADADRQIILNFLEKYRLPAGLEAGTGADTHFTESEVSPLLP